MVHVMVYLIIMLHMVYFMGYFIAILAIEMEEHFPCMLKDVHKGVH